MNAVNVSFRQAFPAPTPTDFPPGHSQLEPIAMAVGSRILSQQQPAACWADGCATTTAAAIVALHELGMTHGPALERSAAWLWARVTDPAADLSETDSFAALAALVHCGLASAESRIQRVAAAIQDLRDIQLADGGWFLESADDAEHLDSYDVSCPETTGRILQVLGRNGAGMNDATVERALEFLEGEQIADGGWAGRFGRAYLSGTWHVLDGLRAVGADMQSAPVRRAVAWLKRIQHIGGGWGEAQPEDNSTRIGAPNLPHTAWALLSLLAAEEWHSPEVEFGMAWLAREVETEVSLPVLVDAATALGRYRRMCMEHFVGNAAF